MTDLRATIERAGTGTREKKVRQAVIIVHGMGEQRPLDALNQFVKAALPPDASGKQDFYSRPDPVTDSYESRMYLAPPAALPGGKQRTQTEFYEYHWAHLMQGNRLDDMWPTLRRMLLQLPTRVPAGLRVVWLLFWMALAYVFGWLLGSTWAFDGGLLGATGDRVATFLTAFFGAGLLGFILTYVITRVLPNSITKSFVDVVRYLDTSPRSYAVRREIRKGMVDLLVALHNSGDYRRIVIVAHSLGAFIAYDGITYLWAHMNKLHGRPGEGDGWPDGLEELEDVAKSLSAQQWESKAEGPGLSAGQVTGYRTAQRKLWTGLRAQGNPWLVTDFITLGTPMYFADRLLTKRVSAFISKVRRFELPTCPPQWEGTANEDGSEDTRRLSWNNYGRRVLHYGAPFAVVRWTNMWFPAELGFFGDWFGHRLAPLFGNGILDIPLKENKRPKWPLRSRFVFGYAHALYLKFPEDDSEGSVTKVLRDAIDFGPSTWLQATADAPDYKEETA